MKYLFIAIYKYYGVQNNLTEPQNANNEMDAEKNNNGNKRLSTAQPQTRPQFETGTEYKFCNTRSFEQARNYA